MLTKLQVVMERLGSYLHDLDGLKSCFVPIKALVIRLGIFSCRLHMERSYFDETLTAGMEWPLSKLQPLSRTLVHLFVRFINEINSKRCCKKKFQLFSNDVIKFSFHLFILSIMTTFFLCYIVKIWGST